MHDVSIRGAVLLTLWFVALLYGMLLIIAVFYIRLAFLQGMRGYADWVMCGIVAFQLVTAGAHSGLVLQQLLYGFQSVPVPELYWADQGAATHVAQTSLYLVNNLIADSVLVWRLYVVCNKNKLVFVPYAILIIGSTATAIGMIYTLSKGNNLAELFEKSLAAWSTTYWSLSIATQLSASCLLAWRIWVIQSRAHRARARMASGYMPIIWIVLESGALLSFATVILLAFYLKKTNAGGVVAGICGQLVSLVPTSILLRVSLSRVSLRGRSDSSLPTALVNVQHDSASSAHTNSERTMVHVERSVDIQEEIEIYRLTKE